jgi:hypothetical protein
VVWQKFTDVSEVLAASIIRAMIDLMMEAAIFVLTAVRTSNPAASRSFVL